MTQNEHIHFDAFILGLKSVDKNQILQNISWKIGRQTNADMTWIADQLIAFENKESSGIGGGVAIAHLKSTPLEKPFILVAKLDTPIDFDAIDEQPVDIVCAVLSPRLDGPLHLRRLARVTRLFREPAILEKLRAAKTEDDMRAALEIEQSQILAA